MSAQPGRQWMVWTALVASLGMPRWVNAQTPLQQGQQFTDWLYQGKLQQLYSRFSSSMRRTVGGLDGLTAFQNKLTDQLGKEVSIVRQDARPILGRTVYDRIARFDKTQKQVQVEWTWDSAGTIVGGFVQSLDQVAASPHLDYQTRSTLQLPFLGEWFVVWGGRTIEDNYHAISRNQRFADDFLIVKNGESHTGDGTANAMYYCWGRSVRAPADGTIVEAVDSLSDNDPGSPSPISTLGNYVIIDHANGEYSVLANLRQGSLAVQKGQPIKAGNPVGECGNSGASTEPHLHYQLQDGPDPARAMGLPAQFSSYVSDGKPVPRGEPRRGEMVHNR